MEDLEKRISEVVSRKLNDGTIEKMIEEQMEKAVKTALDDVFGASGEGRKLLKEKFDTVMCPAIESHDFNKYVTKLDSILTEIINNTRLEENKQILDNFKYLMKDTDYKEIKLSEIFNYYCDCVAKDVDTSELEVYTDDRAYYENVEAEMEVIFDRGIFSNHIDIRFSCEKDKNLEMRLKLYETTNLKGDKIYRILCICDGRNSDINIHSLRYMSSFEVFLRNLKGNFVDVIVDCSDKSEEVEVEAEPEASWS